MAEPRKRKDKDEVTLAKSIFDELVAETESEDFGNDHAERVTVARQKSGKKGGEARAATLTSQRRKEIAKKAAASRWKKS